MPYVPYPAGGLTPGQKVRPLATVGPSVPKADRNPSADDYPWTVDHVQFLGNGRVRVWAHPFGARVSTTSPAHYGTFAELDTVEVTS